MTNEDPKATDSLADAARRLVKKRSFMAYVLALAEGEPLAFARIAESLGCDEATAVRLALMRVPGTARATMQSDADLIASATGLESFAIVSLVKRARALAQFDDDQGDEGLLLAAHDRIPDGDG